MKAAIDDILCQLIDLAAEAEGQRNAALLPYVRQEWQGILGAIESAYTWLLKIQP